MLISDIENNFKVCETDYVKRDKLQALIDERLKFVNLINEMCKDSGEKFTAISRLNEATMFAAVTIIRHD